MLSFFSNCQDVQHTISVEEVCGGGSFAHTGERLCGPDIDRELVPPLPCQKAEENDSTRRGLLERSGTRVRFRQSSPR